MKKFYTLIFLIPSLLVFGQDIAINGGFENWTNGDPDTWTADIGLTVLEENTIITEGTKSAKFILGTQNQADADMGELVETEAAKLYNVSMDVYHTDNASRIRIYVGGETDVYSDPALVNQWQTITFTYFSPYNGYTGLGFRALDIADNWTGSSTFYVDNIVMEEVALADPLVAISSPRDGAYFPEGTTDIELQVAVNNFDMPTTGHYHVFLDGNDVGNNSATGDLTYMLTGVSPGEHTAKVQLYNPDHTPLEPEVSYEMSFSIEASIGVNSIAELRQQVADGTTVYRLVNQARCTFDQEFRNQRFIQDATAGIMVDDPDGLGTGFSINDGVGQFRGTLSEYNGMLQFTPIEESGFLFVPSSVTITPQTITLNELSTNFEEYEAELVKVENVCVDNSVNTNFETGTAYTMTSIDDNSQTFGLYTSFYDADYIGTALSPCYNYIIGLPIERNTGQFLTPRSLEDLDERLGVKDIDYDSYNIRLSNSLVKDQFSVLFNGDAQIQIFNAKGQLMNSTKGEDIVHISSNSWTPGVYFVRITIDNYSVTKKVIKK